MKSPSLHDQTVSQSEFARLVGVSQGLISHLVRAGVLRRGGTLGEWIRAYVDRAVELATPTSTEPDEIRAERLALLKARRELAQLEVGEKRQIVVPVDEAGASVAAACLTVRQVIWSWIGSLPGLLAYKSAPEIAKIIEDEARHLLEDMYRHFPRYVLRSARWLVRNAPRDVWRHAVPMEEMFLSRTAEANDDADG